MITRGAMERPGLGQQHGHSAEPCSPSCGDASPGLHEQCRTSHSIAVLPNALAQVPALHLGSCQFWHAITLSGSAALLPVKLRIGIKYSFLYSLGRLLLMQVACYHGCGFSSSMSHHARLNIITAWDVRLGMA